MPKAASISLSPSASKPIDPGKMSDVALRKKKNADAQAAFRARRANYISTLEETVTNLESVVLQLQESCRDARSEVQDLRQENNHLRHALRERENFWRAVWPRKGHGANGESVDFPPPPTLAASLSPTSFTTLGTTSQIHQYNDPSSYREGASLNNQYSSSTSNTTHSPTIPYSNADNELPNQRASKYPSYATWSQSVAPSSTSSDTCVAPNPSSSSPHFTESPTLQSSDVPYAGRFAPQSDEQKVAMSASIDAATYMPFPASRSLSPSTSTPPSTSTQLGQFSFGIPDALHDQRLPSDVPVNEGTADMSLGNVANDGTRYRQGNRRPDVLVDRSLLPVLPPLSSSSDNGSQHERGSDDGDLPNKRARRGGNTGSRGSRSPSPGVAPLSGTLAVIKAQAFGALRRTRVRTKKPTDTAAKVSMDVLEARGLGLPGTKRRRSEDDLDIPS
ncbi:hypothetical protein Moror_13254 [Moniliophthora roreri MCA 2997]|uniref:BZIP domain-containing protein n=2 Tax=Moniliophthora roreri TaxID=221103 RepID=V2X520_MONRO|nr:hypothetical protein Moror_13254 [Moniliophthora roreri MCA 2997]KAI3622453.1 hypothetical protein WG66_015357 [Moniliophthora roreri]